jgi:hypothetical protein
MVVLPGDFTSPTLCGFVSLPLSRRMSLEFETLAQPALWLRWRYTWVLTQVPPLQL